MGALNHLKYSNFQVNYCLRTGSVHDATRSLQSLSRPRLHRNAKRSSGRHVDVVSRIRIFVGLALALEHDHASDAVPDLRRFGWTKGAAVQHWLQDETGSQATPEL